MTETRVRLAKQIKSALGGSSIRKDSLVFDDAEIRSLRNVERAAWVQLFNWIEDAPLRASHEHLDAYSRRRLAELHRRL